MQGEWKTRGRAHVYGDNLVHDNGMMEWKHVIERQTDPAILIPCLFTAIDPAFVGRVKPGDFVVAGRKFGSGKAHTTAYVAMAALGLRILCESTFERVIGGAVNLGVPIMGKCEGITSVIGMGRRNRGRHGNGGRDEPHHGEDIQLSTGGGRPATNPAGWRS